MTSLWQAPAALLALISWLNAPPVGLADAAHKEAVRRQLVQASVASFTNEDLPVVPSAAPRSADDIPGTDFLVPPAQAAAPPPSVLPPPPPPEPDSEQQAAEQPPRDEQYWRDRVTKVRTALERNQVLLDAMQSRINGLQADVINRDDPAQQAMMRQQLQRSLDEFDRLQKQIAADTQALQDIQVEARRARVPPGWIR